MRAALLLALVPLVALAQFTPPVASSSTGAQTPSSVVTPFVDAGALQALTVVTPFVDAGTIKVDVLDAGTALINGVLRTKGQIIYEGTGQGAISFTGTGNKTIGFAPAGGADLTYRESTNRLESGPQFAAPDYWMLGTTSLLISRTNPTATVCTGAAVSASGTASFQVTVGTGCAAATGTITFTACSTKWTCVCQNVTAPDSNVVSMSGPGTTTSCPIKNYARTTGVASNFTDGHVLQCVAFPW